MAREWKPGDVVRLGNNVAMRVKQDGDTYFISPIGTHWRDCDDVARPLVVIDPEDREQVERLTKAIVEAAFKHGNLPVAHNGIHGDTTEAALREFANPTPLKPEEPTGLGAVVEDINGSHWLRFKPTGSRPWMYAGVGRVAEDRRYSDIAVVKVLSPGAHISEGVQS